MKKEFWFIAFIVVLVAHITGIQLNYELMQSISKPLLIPLLIAYFLSKTNTVASNLKKWILLALFFSWGGDVLLMFVSKNEIFFLLGLVSFLLAHIFYGLCFTRIIKRNKIDRNNFFFILSIGYVIFLLRWLTPHLGEMKWPVVIYGSVLGGMFCSSLHLEALANKKAGYFIIFGALLFVISDSVLAINKFYHSFELAGLVIMITYGLAQLFIVEGASRYIRSKDNQ